MPLETYDLVILGCGTASKLAAWDFASQGQRVAVVERHYPTMVEGLGALFSFGLQNAASRQQTAGA